VRQSDPKSAPAHGRAALLWNLTPRNKRELPILANTSDKLSQNACFVSGLLQPSGECGDELKDVVAQYLRADANRLFLGQFAPIGLLSLSNCQDLFVTVKSIRSRPLNVSPFGRWDRCVHACALAAQMP
jgi:hypothetical protein